MKEAFMAVGNNELGEALGDSVECPNCGENHPVTYGERVTYDPVTGEEVGREVSDALAFVNCGNKSFLVGVEGKALKRVTPPEPTWKPGKREG